MARRGYWIDPTDPESIKQLTPEGQKKFKNAFAHAMLKQTIDNMDLADAPKVEKQNVRPE